MNAKTIMIGAAGWILVHVGLFGAGMLTGTALDLPLLHGPEAEGVHCEEDEVAIHGGLGDWYDPSMPLECVHFDDFPELFPPPAPVIGEAWTAGPTQTPSPMPSPTPSPTPTPEPATETMDVWLTYYTCPPFCVGDTMANGQPLHPGAVACGYALDEGQWFRFRGDEYVCEDRGAGSWQWVDFWKETGEIGRAWQAEVGQYGEIELIGGPSWTSTR